MRKDKEEPLTDRERHSHISEVLEELRTLSEDHVLLIEGKKDGYALDALGIAGDRYMIQSGGGPVDAVQYVEGHGGKAVILTDWDRRGESLAEHLATLLGPKANTDIRDRLIKYCKTDIKDMESLDTLMARLGSSDN